MMKVCRNVLGRIIVAVLCITMIVTFIPLIDKTGIISNADNSEAWSTAYKDYIFNGTYLSYGGSDGYGNRSDIAFGLYDFDNNGIPEIIAYNGGMGMAETIDHVYSYQNGKVKYLGDIGYRSAAREFYSHSSYSGCYIYTGNMGDYVCDYYYIKNGNLYYETVFEDHDVLSDGLKAKDAIEIITDPSYWNVYRFLKTDDIGLYYDYKKCNSTVPMYTLAEIKSMGWENFVNQFRTYAKNVNIEIDGKELSIASSLGSPFIDESNRTQVPLRAIMEAIGCDVDWDGTNNVAIVKKSGTTVKVPIGQKYILVNDIKQSIDTAAIIKDSRTYLPIRAVLEAFGYSVAWDGSSRTVTVNKAAVDKATEEIKEIYPADMIGKTISEIIQIYGDNFEITREGELGMKGIEYKINNGFRVSFFVYDENYENDNPPAMNLECEMVLCMGGEKDEIYKGVYAYYTYNELKSAFGNKVSELTVDYDFGGLYNARFDYGGHRFNYNWWEPDGDLWGVMIG